jgi:hypothetical protein
MTTTIRDICQDVQRMLLAQSADYLPGFRYSAIPAGQELDDIDSGRDTMRSLKVQPGPVLGQGHFDGTSYSTVQAVSVGIRYLFDSTSPDASDRADAMWGADIAQFVRTLTRPPLDGGWSVAHYGFRFRSADQLVQGQFEESCVYLGVLEFEVEYGNTDALVGPVVTTFDTYDAVVAYLVAQGNTFKQAVPLYKFGYGGQPQWILGHLGWSNDATPKIVAVGPFNWSMVTDGGWAKVAGVPSGTTVALTTVHTLPASCRVLVWGTATGVERYYDVLASIVGDVMTLPATAGILAGDQVFALGRSEFTIGGSTRNMQPQAIAGSTFYIAVHPTDPLQRGPRTENGTTIIPMNGKRPTRMKCYLWIEAAEVNQYAGAGYRSSSLHHAGCLKYLQGAAQAAPIVAYDSLSTPAFLTSMVNFCATFGGAHEFVTQNNVNTLVNAVYDAGVLVCMGYGSSNNYAATEPDGIVIHARSGGSKRVACILLESRME